MNADRLSLSLPNLNRNPVTTEIAPMIRLSALVFRDQTGARTGNQDRAANAGDAAPARC